MSRRDASPFMLRRYRCVPYISIHDGSWLLPHFVYVARASRPEVDVMCVQEDLIYFANSAQWKTKKPNQNTRAAWHTHTDTRSNNSGHVRAVCVCVCRCKICVYIWCGASSDILYTMYECVQLHHIRARFYFLWTFCGLVDFPLIYVLVRAFAW